MSKDDPIIEATGAMWEYFVHSASNPNGQFHVVTLNENAPLGLCTCIDFTCRRLPAFRKTGKIVRCWHINAVRERVLNYVISNATPSK